MVDFALNSVALSIGVSRFTCLPRDAMLSAVYAVVVCLSGSLSVCVCVCLSVTLRHTRSGTLYTDSASRSPSAELLVELYSAFLVENDQF